MIAAVNNEELLSNSNYQMVRHDLQYFKSQRRRGTNVDTQLHQIRTN